MKKIFYIFLAMGICSGIWAIVTFLPFMQNAGPGLEKGICVYLGSVIIMAAAVAPFSFHQMLLIISTTFTGNRMPGLCEAYRK